MSRLLRSAAGLTLALLTPLASLAKTGPGFRCAITRYTGAGEMIETMTIVGEAKFEGTDRFEQIKLSFTGKHQAIEVRRFHKTPADPYAVESMTCTRDMSCKARREAYSKKRPVSAKFKLRSRVGGMQAVAGNRVMAAQHLIPGGFAFTADSESGPPRVGVDITCSPP